METSRVHLNVRLQQQTPTCQAAGAPGSEKPQPTPIPSRSVPGQRREAPARPGPTRPGPRPHHPPGAGPPARGGRPGAPRRGVAAGQRSSVANPPQGLAPERRPCSLPVAPGRGLPAAKSLVPAESAPPRGLGPRHLRPPCLGFALLLVLRTAPARLRSRLEVSGG